MQTRITCLFESVHINQRVNSSTEHKAADQLVIHAKRNRKCTCLIADDYLQPRDATLTL